MAISNVIDAAHAAIEANWNYRTTGDPIAYLEAIDVLLAIRPNSMSKGGTTQEEVRFDHATLKRMRDDVEEFMKAKKVALGGTHHMTFGCQR